MSDIPGNPKVSRKLAAILAADIAGYSALMGADDEATVRDLKAHQAVILPLVGEHGGRIIDTAGDGILAEFASVVNAVECAVAIQKAMAERNAGTNAERRMRFRIGVNLGDVIHDEQRVYGDGVNIAARLEAIAEPGGICLSGEAFGQVQRRLQLPAVDFGDQQLKNIARPVRLYRVAAEHFSAPHPPTRAALSLPDKPSLAVLPFTNLSRDPKEDYFSDGITEDIITELSRFSELFVIARNSSFQFKGKSPDIRQVGRDLGVRYVLEGSVRRSGDRIRISAQLIDSTTGTHRWAERYDRMLEDVFAVQDEVVHTIVPILAAHVRKAEVERTHAKPPNSWQAYDYYLQAVDAFAAISSSSVLAERIRERRRLLQQSLAIDPSYARSYALLAETDVAAWSDPVDEDFLNTAVLDRAHQFARTAVQLARSNSASGPCRARFRPDLEASARRLHCNIRESHGAQSELRGLSLWHGTDFRRRFEAGDRRRTDVHATRSVLPACDFTRPRIRALHARAVPTSADAAARLCRPGPDVPARSRPLGCDPCANGPARGRTSRGGRGSTIRTELYDFRCRARAQRVQVGTRRQAFL